MIWKLVLFIYFFRKLIRVEISTSVRHQRPGMGGDYDQCYQGGPKRHRRREYPRDKLERGPRRVLAPWLLNNGGYGACPLPDVVANHFPRIPMVPHIKKESDIGTQSFETYLLLSNQLLP